MNMSFAPFLSAMDAERAHRSLARLRKHGLHRLALTGGMAIELHRLRLGFAPRIRPLNDIDFLVDFFDDIPQTLSTDLLFRHIHPHDPPARTLLQCVDPQTAVRIDVFRAYGETMSRAIEVELHGAAIRIVSIEDLTARAARLCMDLALDVPTPAKHARDLLCLLPIVGIATMEPVWREHRKESHPESFASAAALLRALIDNRRQLQIVPAYSHDVSAHCSRCQATQAFPLADSGQILSLLAYC
jgi:hypothetical protein